MLSQFKSQLTESPKNVWFWENLKSRNDYKLISLVVSHNPPETLYKLISQLLLISDKIVIIDSSNMELYNNIKNKLTNEKIILIHENNDYGLGSALAYGMKIASQFIYDYLLIMEDDSLFIYNDGEINLNINGIIKNFTRTFDRNDVLYLSDHSNINNNEFIIISDYLGTNTGLLLNSALSKKINFRLDFYIDQIDIDLQYNIKKMGGNLVLTKYKIIDRLPVGRENKNGVNTIPIFRFYLLTRNSIILFMERKISPKHLFFILGYFLKGLVSGQSVYYLLIALFYGVIDGLKTNSGITKTLKFFRHDLHI